MLSKNVDQVVIGKSIFSVLLGLQLLQKGSKVLLLDDDRVSYGELYERLLSHTVIHSLKTWGEELGLDPLVNIENSLKSSQQVLHVQTSSGQRRVLLGSSPWSNMLELTRKLGHPGGSSLLPNKESFDEEVSGALARLGRDIYRFQALSQLDAKNLTSHFSASFMNWAEPIVTPFFGRKKLDLTRPWDAFFYLARAIYHQKLSLDFSSAEVWHLLLEAIAPRYELELDGLVEELIGIYQLRGGQYKRARVREWMFYKSSPWSLELSSYEGIIHPRKLVVMGSSSHEIGLELEPQYPIYNSVRLTFDGSYSASGGTRHFMFATNEVGTDFGPWTISCHEGDKIFVDCAIKRRPGMKIDFYTDKLMARAHDLLRTTFPLSDFGPDAQTAPNIGREVWLDEHFNKRSRFRGDILVAKPIKLRQVRSPGDTELVKNVSYFGPSKRDHLGLLSSLLEMKESLPRLQ